MLQIYVYRNLPQDLTGLVNYIMGPVTDGFLDLLPGTVLNVESINDFFSEDFTTGEFSLPITIPWTDNNRKILGFAERLKNFTNKDNFYVCDVLDKGFPEMVGAKLTILEREGAFSYRTGSFSATISGVKGLYGSLIKKKKLTDLQYGGDVRPPFLDGHNNRTLATAIMKGEYPEFNHVRYAPVAIENFIDTERKDYTTEFLALDQVNALVLTGAGADDWEFGKPSIADPTVAAVIGTTEYLEFRTVPFLQAKHVLLSCFSEFGYTLTGEFLTSPDFEDLVLFNNYSTEHYQTFFLEDLVGAGVTPSNHVPEMLISEFLKEFCQFFNLYIRFLPNNQCQLLRRTTAFTSNQILSINQIADNNFSAAPYNTTNEKGYTLRYNFDSRDQFPGEAVKSLEGKTLVGSVPAYEDLEDLEDLLVDLTTDSIALVTNENLYYVVADATTDPMVWEVFAENLHEYKYLEGEKQVDFAMAPMCQYVEKDTGTGLMTRRNMVGAKMRGSYFAFSNAFVKSPFGLRCFYIKKMLVGTNNIPVSFNHNTYPDGTELESYSLAFAGDKGMDINFHKVWQLTLLRAELVKLIMNTDKKTLGDMRNTVKFELMNIMLMRYREERTIPLNGQINVEMITL